MRIGLGLVGSTSPVISTWILPESLLKPTLHLPGW